MKSYYPLKSGKIYLVAGRLKVGLEHFVFFVPRGGYHDSHTVGTVALIKLISHQIPH